MSQGFSEKLRLSRIVMYFCMKIDNSVPYRYVGQNVRLVYSALRIIININVLLPMKDLGQKITIQP